MAEPLSTSISLAALMISGVTAWFTLVRRGTIRMTKPAFVAFAYYTPRPGRLAIPKFFLRALIYWQEFEKLQPELLAEVAVLGAK
jgi:hypothetical protein